MKKITKSRLIALVWILGIVLIIAYVSGHFYNEFQRLQYNMSSNEVKNFGKYKKSFEIVAKKSLELYEEEKKNNNEISCIIIINVENNNWLLVCHTDNGDESYEILKEVSEKENEAMIQAEAAIGTASYPTDLYRVQVLEDRVIFMMNRPYAVIYMDNWRRPDYMFSENETAKFYAERLAPRWYQAAHE